MMGEPVGRQDRLFYDFDLEDVVPDDHLLRKIDAVLDLSWLLGIDEDVMNEDIRLSEVRNWIEQLVLPSMVR